MIEETIETSRISLIKVTQKEYDFVFENYSKDQIMKFFGHQSEADYEKELLRHQNGMSTFNKKFVFFFLREKDSEKVIGWCGYHTWFIDHYKAELGYILFNDAFKNHGFMSEVLPFVIDYGFKKMNLHRIEAMVAPGNVPSLKLLEKLNFKEEGLLKENYFKNGNPEDSLMLALMRKDYPL